MFFDTKNTFLPVLPVTERAQVYKQVLVLILMKRRQGLSSIRASSSHLSTARRMDDAVARDAENWN